MAPGGPPEASPSPRTQSGAGRCVGRPSAPATLQDREDPADRVRGRPRPMSCEGSLPIWGLKRNRPPFPPRRRSTRRYLHRRAPLRRTALRRRARPPAGRPSPRPPPRTPRKREASHHREVEDRIARAADRCSEVGKIWRRLVSSLDAGPWSHTRPLCVIEPFHSGD